MKSSNVRRGKTRNAMRFGGMTSAGLDRGFVALGQRLVAFGVRAHPALGWRAGERPADLGGRAESEHTFRNFRLGCDEGAGGYHGAGSDPRAVEDGRAVADQAFLAERRRVDRAIGADGRARADLHAAAGRDVDDGAILHVGASANHDWIEVAAKHGVVPHRCALLDGHVADENRGGCDERRRMDLRALALEAEQWHGLDPRSILETALILLERGSDRRWECRFRGSQPSLPRHRLTASRRRRSWRSPATPTRSAAASSAAATSTAATSGSIRRPSGPMNRSTSSTIASAPAPCTSASRRHAGFWSAPAGMRATSTSSRRRRALDASRRASTRT